MINFEEIWSMLNKHNFEIDPNHQSYVSCIICKKLLVDAFYGPCFCNYCKKCIENLMGKGERFCPGDTIACKQEELYMEINLKADVRANRNVSELKVRCPFESCKVHCKIIDMCTHLRVCDKREIFCPFNEIGCTIISMHNKEIEEHLMKDMYNHTKLMMDCIVNIKNDLTSVILKVSNDNLKSNLQTLGNSSSLIISEENNKQFSFDCLTKEMKELKEKIENLKNVNEEKFEIQISTLDEYKEKNINLCTEINNLKDSLNDLKKEISFIKSDDNNNNLNSKTKEALEGLEDPEFSNTILFRRTASLIKPSPKPDYLNFLIENDNGTGVLLWELSDIQKLKKMNKLSYSDYFYTVKGHHKIWICLYAGGCNDHLDTRICIQFNVCDSPYPDKITWPLKSKISLNIKNKTNPKIFKYFTRNGKLDPYKPEIFHLLYSGLKEHLKHNTLLIECEVVAD